ncbi:GlcG/HbpS family heme-binding protein [Acinetobacter ihumii]|uniref:GlcG/HbpS family heme-binding protein n=1 Tax=Acinetobacter ihumii TaxID=2483802 RepID=UPI001030841F|nr:heme-binding protein [Acinetobacter ihumii]
MHSISMIQLELAQQLIHVGREKALAIDSPSNLAVVDAYGFLLTHIRMDGAQLPSIEHSINKAYTSALFKKSTEALKQLSEPDGELYGLNLTLNQRVIVFAGGLPLLLNDDVVGAVGVSGGTAEQDQCIAQSMQDYFNHLQQQHNESNQ